MKILIIGTGALGCFYGGLLAKNKVDIIFTSRGDSYQAIKKEGIIIQSDIIGRHIIPVHIANKIPDDTPYSLVIIATKSYDVIPLLDQIPSQLYKQSYFMTLQNGVQSEDILITKIDPQRLLPVSCFVGLKKISNNTAHHSAGGRFQFGSYTNQNMEGFLEEIYTLFTQSGIDTHFSDNIMKIKWGKLVWNASYNPLSTITQLKLGNILESSHGVNLLRNAMIETANIARKLGYNISDEYIDKQIDLPKNLYSFKTSMLQDFQSGKSLEIEAILGDLIKKGIATGINTPTISIFYSLIQILVNHRDHPMEY